MGLEVLTEKLLAFSAVEASEKRESVSISTGVQRGAGYDIPVAAKFRVVSSYTVANLETLDIVGEA